MMGYAFSIGTLTKIAVAAAIVVGIAIVIYAVYRLVGTQEATLTWQRMLTLEERQSQLARNENPEPTVFPPPWPDLRTPPASTPQPTPTERPEPKKHISLGLNEDPQTRRALLPMFTYKLNQKLNPENIYVYDYGDDWLKHGLANTFQPFEKRFTEATGNAEHIHFNLEGILGDPIEFAEKLGPKGFSNNNFAAAELYYIRHSGLCTKTSFYEQGSIAAVESPELKAKICKLP